MKQRSPATVGVLIAMAVIGLLIGVWLFQRLAGIIVLVLIALVLATGIDPLVERIHGLRGPRDWHPPRSLAILLVLLAAVVVFAGALLYIGSVIWSEGTQIWQHAPHYANVIRDWVAGLRQQYPRIPPLENAAERLRGQMGTVAGHAAAEVAALFGILGGFLSVFTVLVLTYYLSASKSGIRNAFLAIIPPDRRDVICGALSEAGRNMGGWLRGQLLLALIALVLVSGLMWVLGMPYPLLLGLVAATGELVPMMGPFIAGIIAVPIAFFTQPTWVAIVLIAFFVVYSQVEGNWLSPRITESQVGLPPLTTILALLAGASLLGVVGALLAVPVAAGLRVLVLKLVVPAIQNAQRRAEERATVP